MLRSIVVCNAKILFMASPIMVIIFSNKFGIDRINYTQTEKIVIRP